MKNFLLLFFVLFTASEIILGQCYLVNSLPLHTGYNPTSNSAIPIGDPDPRWIITNSQNIPGAVNNTASVVCTPNMNAAVIPNTGWISYAEPCSYNTSNPNQGFYNITFRFDFRTCVADSLFFNLALGFDNYVADLRIDGMSIGYGQAPFQSAATWLSLDTVTHLGYYPAGNHSIEVDVVNFYPGQAGPNPHSFYAHGFVNSLTNNSIVNPLTSVPSCVCHPFTTNAYYTLINICTGLTFQFIDYSIANSGFIVSWLWDFGDGNTSTLQGPIHTYAAPGTYTVTLTAINNFNEISSYSFQAAVTLPPPVNIIATSSHTGICAGNPVTLQATGAYTYTWNNGVASGVTFVPSSSLWYVVTGIDTNGCSGVDSVYVEVYPIPNVSASANPAQLCPGQSTTLNATGAQQYVWSGGISNGIPFVPTTMGTYTVTGTDINGCSATSTVALSLIQSIPVSITPSTFLLCRGDSVLLNASGADYYSWDATPGLSDYTSASPWAFPESNTIYYVVGTSIEGCTGSATASIEVIDHIDVYVSKNRDAECNNKVVELSASGAENYLWSPTSSLSNPTGSTTLATIDSTITFYVIGQVGSCIDLDSITVFLYKNEQKDIFIPNAFSPNNDGLNDCFGIKQQANFTNFYWTIYNRWGQRVFESDTPDACWNGEFQNKKAPTDTYFYFIEAETVCGKILLRGDILLIR